MRTVPPGADTAILRGENDGSGIGLLEVCEFCRRSGPVEPSDLTLRTHGFGAQLGGAC